MTTEKDHSDICEGCRGIVKQLQIQNRTLKEEYDASVHDLGHARLKLQESERVNGELRDVIRDLRGFISETFYANTSHDEKPLPNSWYKQTSKTYGDVLEEIMARATDLNPYHEVCALCYHPAPNGPHEECQKRWDAADPINQVKESHKETLRAGIEISTRLAQAEWLNKHLQDALEECACAQHMHEAADPRTGCHGPCPVCTAMSALGLKLPKDWDTEKDQRECETAIEALKLKLGLVEKRPCPGWYRTAYNEQLACSRNGGHDGMHSVVVDGFRYEWGAGRIHTISGKRPDKYDPAKGVCRWCEKGWPIQEVQKMHRAPDTGEMLKCELR